MSNKRHYSDADSEESSENDFSDSDVKRYLKIKEQKSQEKNDENSQNQANLQKPHGRYKNKTKIGKNNDNDIYIERKMEN